MTPIRSTVCGDGAEHQAGVDTGFPRIDARLAVDADVGRIQLHGADGLQQRRRHVESAATGERQSLSAAPAHGEVEWGLDRLTPNRALDEVVCLCEREVEAEPPAAQVLRTSPSGWPRRHRVHLRRKTADTAGLSRRVIESMV